MARLGVPYVLMHWRGPSDTMQQHTTYDDVVGDVVAETSTSLAMEAQASLAVRAASKQRAVEPPSLSVSPCRFNAGQSCQFAEPLEEALIAELLRFRWLYPTRYIPAH